MVDETTPELPPGDDASGHPSGHPSDLSGLASPPPALEPALEFESPAEETAVVEVAKPALVQCPRCGAANYDVVSRCAECGYRFTLRCPECRAVNAGDASTCKTCGHRLISAAHGAWRVGPVSSLALARQRSRRASPRRDFKMKPKGHSALFYIIVVTGAITLALAILIVVLTLALSGYVFGG
jgi:Double zinc ribbon